MELFIHVCPDTRVYFNGPTFLMFVNPDLILYNQKSITELLVLAASSIWAVQTWILHRGGT